MSDSFSDHPMSISELRADKTGMAKDDTPRDVLVRFLREIDRGEQNPDAVVVIVGKIMPDGGVEHHTRVSAPNAFVSAGLAAYAVQSLTQDD